MLKRLFRALVVQRRTRQVYVYCRKQEDQGRKDPCVTCFDSANPPPAWVSDEFKAMVGRLLWFTMHRRLKRGRARLLVLVENGRLCGYGWLQDWAYFKRRYGWLSDTGTIVGFNYTKPSERGRGVFGRLLKHQVALCEEKGLLPLFGFVDPANSASRRGLERVGFVRLGTYGMVWYFFRMFARYRVIEQERTLAQATEECAGAKPASAEPAAEKTEATGS